MNLTNRQPEGSTPAEHPTQAALCDFLTGRLEESELSNIEQHLIACASCCRDLGGLSRREDTFQAELVAAVAAGNQLLPSPDLRSIANTAPADGNEIPKRIGRFEIRRNIGQGGFGVVYLAYDPQLRREVAIKVPRLGAHLSAESRERFLRESQAAAALDHYNIVPVYETGSHDNVCYIVTGVCHGPDMATWLKQRDSPVPVAAAASISTQLADAVAHAHSRGVLHRDLKPGNILLVPDASGDANEFPFIPKITDFGLAKMLDDESEATASHALMGTPAYMSPEQASGMQREIGFESDVYSIGVILYELLTGRPPLVGETDVDTIQRVRDKQPEPPSHWRAETPRDLETLCLTCLEKDPKRRYASAGELADDLRRFMSREPIRAQRRTIRDRTISWCSYPQRMRDAGLLAILAAVLLTFWDLLLLAQIVVGVRQTRDVTTTLGAVMTLILVVFVPLGVIGWHTLHARRWAIQIGVLFPLPFLFSSTAYMFGLRALYDPVMDACAIPADQDARNLLCGLHVVLATLVAATFAIALFASQRANRRLSETSPDSSF